MSETWDEVLRRAAQEIRKQAVMRFDAHGARDERGAAMWDVASWIDPDDQNALAPKN